MLEPIANHVTIKQNGLVSPLYDYMFSCERCQPGCERCLDNSPCLSTYNWAFRISLLTIAIFCILFIFILAMNIYRYRRLKVIKVASPIFLCITLLGCVIMYLEVNLYIPNYYIQFNCFNFNFIYLAKQYFYTWHYSIHFYLAKPNKSNNYYLIVLKMKIQTVIIFPVMDTTICILTKWTRHFGFCLTYSSLLLKTWRVSLTYRVKSAHKIKLTDKQLLQWLFPILLVMAIYLCTWTISDSPKPLYIVDWNNLKFKQCDYNWWDHSISIGKLVF